MLPATADIIQGNRRSAGEYVYIHHFNVLVFPRKYRTFINHWAAKILDIEDGYVAIKFETGRPVKIDLESNIILAEKDFDLVYAIAKELAHEKYDRNKFDVSLYVLSKTPKIDDFKFGHQISDAAKAATTEKRKKQKA